ncbi:hypothetical protein RCL1_004426 [Eukaryota sp. TZLM3-RCL]
MQRRVIRLRKEYLYKKALNVQAEEDAEKKGKIRKALAEGIPVPSDLRKSLGDLKEQIVAEDAETMDPSSFIDDEYSTFTSDPRILMTTSRDPSTRLIQFAKEMKLIFPNSERINRGSTTMGQLVEIGRRHNVTDLVILHETRGEPDGLIVSHMPYGPTAFFSLSNAVLRHDVPDVQPMSEAFPHLIFDNFDSPLGQRFVKILKHLFPVPKEDSKRVITFSNNSDFISFRHHTFTSASEGHKIELAEVGPRFVLRPYLLRLGSLEMEEAEVEWALRPYMNTAKKRTFLS